MFEPLFFIISAIILFGVMFFKMIKKNDTEYIIIIAIQALGILIDLIIILADLEKNLFINSIIYFMSIILPLIIIYIEKKQIVFWKRIRMLVVEINIAAKNTKKAKDMLLKILEKDGENYEAHSKLAQIYELEGGMRKAIDEYVQCIDLNKQDYDSYYKVAYLLSELDRKDEAIEMYNNLLNNKSDYYQATIDLGELLIEKDMYKEAANIYLEALKDNPASYELNYNLGIVYTMLNDFKSAKEFYEKAAQINSLAHNPKYCLAEIALLYKELQKAEEYFSMLVDDEELSADCYFELAKINIMKGQRDIAIRYANTAIDIDSKRISQKIKEEPLFITIMTKISIPFNLEEREIKRPLSLKEKKAKKHLEETTELTANMGYVAHKEKNKIYEKNEIEKSDM